MSKLPFSLESMNYEATQRWVEQAYSVPNYLKSACMHFGIKYVGVKKDWMSKQLLMRLNNKQGSEQVIEKSQVAKIIPVTKDGDILSIPVNSTVVTHSASHLTCDVLDGWDGQSSDVLKGWIGKSSPILSEPYDIKTTNTNYPYIKQFTVNGVEIKREWKDENPLRFGYFVFNKFIDIRFITDYMTIVEDWDTPSVIYDDYDKLYQQRDNYQTYAEWDEKVWIPYVQSVILTYIKKPEQEISVTPKSLEDQHKAILAKIESCEDWEQIAELEEKAQEIFKQIKVQKEEKKKEKKPRSKKELITGLKGKKVKDKGVTGQKREKLLDFLSEWRTKQEIANYMGWGLGNTRDHFTYIRRWGYTLLTQGKKDSRQYKLEG